MTSPKRASFPNQLVKVAFLAIAAVGVAFPSVSSAQTVAASSSVSPSASRASAALSKGNAAKQANLVDGTYLFGQSPNRDVMGSAYAVISVKGRQAVGAFYHPHSSFDCFSGEISASHLALNVVDSYTQTQHPYTVSLAASDTLVAGGTAAGTTYTLEGFHRIGEPSAEDYEMLRVCQADFAQ